VLILGGDDDQALLRGTLPHRCRSEKIEPPLCRPELNGHVAYPICLIGMD
jgi:hypothetical protein